MPLPILFCSFEIGIGNALAHLGIGITSNCLALFASELDISARNEHNSSSPVFFSFFIGFG